MFLWTGQHRGVDLRRCSGSEIGGVLARGERAALAGEVVARCAVQPEKVTAAGDVVADQGLRRNLAVLVPGDNRATAVGLYVGAERVDLGLVELRRLLRRLRLATHRGHPAG